MTSAPDKKDYSWTGALVLWLWEETHIQEVVGLNYGTGYHCKNGNVCLKILKINDKRGRGWPIFLKKTKTISCCHLRTAKTRPTILVESRTIRSVQIRTKLDLDLWSFPHLNLQEQVVGIMGRNSSKLIEIA